VKLSLAIVQIRLEMAEIELLTGKKVRFSKQGKPGFVSSCATSKAIKVEITIGKCINFQPE